MEARFERNSLQDATGWHERSFTLEDQRQIRRIRHLHRLTLAWIESHSDWKGESERFLKSLRFPSHLRLPSERALALLESDTPEGLVSQLLDEKPAIDCLLRLHQLAWLVHVQALQRLAPEDAPSLLAGERAASAYFKYLGMSAAQRLHWNAADLAHVLAGRDTWLGGNPNQEQGSHPFFLFRRITPESVSFEILAAPGTREEEQLRDHHVKWLEGWVRSASEGKYHLARGPKKTHRNAQILEVIPS